MTTTQITEAGLVRSGRATLSEQLAERYAERIRQRLLGPGARLPSVRACAERHGVSPSTVVGAYDLLQAQGLVQARPQRGFFVRESAAADRRAARAPSGAPTTRPTDA
ncbi:MAG: winged helix-turn-helix transcriptional regulator, partial [Rubrivivax sp.]|nr:winged helix-turn-helix transcriptional regulator [Rubrivivax sp.]